MIEIEEQQGQTIVRPGFDLVSHRVVELRDTILDLAAQGRQKVILDLVRVTLIDSMGVGVVVACLKTLKQRGGDLKVTTDNEDIIRLFNLLKLGYILI